MADRQEVPGAAPGPLAVTELLAIARRRHWGLVAPGLTGSDNVPVLAPAEDGRWRVGYKERGVTDWDATSLPEADAVAVVYQQLRSYHEGLDR